jgi:hypothetical protein
MVVVCTGLGYAPVALAQRPASDRTDEKTESTVVISELMTRTAPPSSEAASDLLRRRVESVDWTDKTFEEILDWLRDQGEGRVNVVPRWGPLGVESVNRESLVTLQMNNTSVGEVLNEAVLQLSEDGEIRYRGIGNNLAITTRQDFERKLHTQVYDVTDILFRVPDFGQDAPRIDLSQQRNSGGGGQGGGSSQPVFGGAGGGAQGQQENESGQQAEQQIEQRLGRLRDVIRASVAPETWDVPAAGGAVGGGGRGRIEIHGRALVITNTIEVHEMIAGTFLLGR